MANDNETVGQVLERMTRGMGRDCSVECQLLESDVVEYADRILTAHNREIDAIAAQKTAEAHEAFVKNAELAEAIAAKDAEIASLRLLVKELADALDNYPCHNCKRGSERCEWCWTVQKLDALIAKARKAF